MQEKIHIKKYLLPIALAVILVISLVLGILYMRNFLMELTVKERSNQLKEIVTQIQANLTSGLETHWNLVLGMEKTLSNKQLDEEDVSDIIAYLEDVYCTELYDCKVMLIDTQGNAYLSSGPIGIWNDISHLIGNKKQYTFISETDQIDGCYLVFSQEFDHAINRKKDNISFSHIVLLKDIQTVKQYYTTTTYGGSAATYIIRENGILAYYDAVDEDVIGARNIFKALREVEYVQHESFDSVKEQLDSEGIVATNIIINQREYFYCLTSLGSYNMTLMLLIPSDSVAINTLNMMNATIRTETIFLLAMLLLSMLAIISFVNVQRSRQIVKLEQKNNRELNQLRLEAESANAAKSSFLNNMSHDIRTPMNAIIGFTNIALKHNPTSEVKDCLDKISDSSEHLLTLINDVLDISRIESGKIQFSPIVTNIKQVNETIVNILYGFLVNRSINFEFYQEEPINEYVLADAVRIREIFVNILGNAVKFTGDGGSIKFFVNYFTTEDSDTFIARYIISDTGVGMSKEFINHIFDEFSQEENSARTMYKGTGLGMAITKRYVDLLGGNISVESEKGIGSTFTVEIPMKVTTANELNNNNNNRYSLNKIDLKSLNVLLVEDNDLNAEIAIYQLEEQGIKVTRACNGEEAVILFKDNPPLTFDLILMDVMMPKLNGYEATKQIRSLINRPDSKSIPIIAMTANAFAEDVEASLASGMNDHLSKPIVVDELVKTIARNIDK